MTRTIFLDRAARTVTTFLLLTATLSAALAAAPTTPADVKGGHDDPLIQRFAGSWMIGYKHAEFDQSQFPTGTRIKDEKWVDPVTVEGKVTKIFYLSPLGKTPIEVFRNYQQALVAAGFKARVVCERDCTDQSWAMRRTIEPPNGVSWANGGMESIGGGSYSLTGGVLTPTNARLWYGTLPRDGQDVHVLLHVSDAENESTHVASTFLQIAEPKAMQTGQVKVDAKALGQGLEANGKIALYGLYFDTGKADVKPESKPQLDEMAKLMQTQAALKVYIVGHTDNQGSLESNVTLSQQRAQAVVAALVKDYKIDAKRLVARGVASLAPVAANASETGRAKNRRVELVTQ